MKRGDLGRMPLEIGEVEVIGQSLLFPWKPHGFEQRLHVGIIYLQLQLGAALFLNDMNYRPGRDLVQQLVHVLRPLRIQFYPRDLQMESLQRRTVLLWADLLQLPERGIVRGILPADPSHTLVHANTVTLHHEVRQIWKTVVHLRFLRPPPSAVIRGNVNP